MKLTEPTSAIAIPDIVDAPDVWVLVTQANTQSPRSVH